MAEAELSCGTPGFKQPQDVRCSAQSRWQQPSDTARQTHARTHALYFVSSLTSRKAVTHGPLSFSAGRGHYRHSLAANRDQFLLFNLSRTNGNYVYHLL